MACPLNVWRRALGVDRAAVIDSVEFNGEAESALIHVRARLSTNRRRGFSGRHSRDYDQGPGATGQRTRSRRDTELSAGQRLTGQLFRAPDHGISDDLGPARESCRRLARPVPRTYDGLPHDNDDARS